jgi:putative DNA primase/helicase
LPGAFERNDSGNGERFAARYRDRLRYVNRRQRWLCWNGTEWAWDETGVAELCTKELARAIHDEADACNDDQQVKALREWSFKSGSMGKRKAMLEAARSEPGMSISVDQLDTDPWLLNCPNGTLNLRTGQLKEHSRGDYITKQTGTRYNPQAATMLWDEVLNNMTGGDTELGAYLQRVAGYALTGVATERKFFFLYGPPGSGKSTFIEALLSCMGTYGKSTSFDTWLEHPNVGGNRDDLVALQGIRLVTSGEVEPGKRWASALLKQITGGDRIAACAKYEKEVEFVASCTIIMAANDSPKARDDDAGFWERMQRVPITNVVALDKRIPELHSLMREPENAEAILAWAVEGCKLWQKHRIGSAPVVEQSTAEYREENDWIGGFLEMYEEDERSTITATAFRDQYERYCKQEGQKPEATKTLARRIEKRMPGVRYKKVHGQRLWTGIRLTGAETDLGPEQGALPGVDLDDMPPDERFE